MGAANGVVRPTAQLHRAPLAEIGAHTRERLLDVAERLFASRGFAAASVREITTAAGSNLAAVNYHFGGKHNLYGEVFRRRMALLRERRIASLERALSEAGDRVDLEFVLGAFANAFLEPFLSDSNGRLLLALMTRELLDPNLPPGLLQTELVQPVHTALAKAIAAVEPGLEPQALRLCIVSFIAQLVHGARLHVASKRGTRAKALDVPLAELADHIVEFTAAGIRARSARKPQPGSSREHRAADDGGRTKGRGPEPYSTPTAARSEPRARPPARQDRPSQQRPAGASGLGKAGA